MDPYWYPFFIFSLKRLPAKETEHSQTRKERKTRNRAPHVPLVSVQLGWLFIYLFIFFLIFIIIIIFFVEVVEEKEGETERDKHK